MSKYGGMSGKGLAFHLRKQNATFGAPAASYGRIERHTDVPAWQPEPWGHPMTHRHMWVPGANGPVCADPTCKMQLKSHGIDTTSIGRAIIAKVEAMLCEHCPNGGDMEHHVLEAPYKL